MEEILRRDIDRFVEENTEAIKRDIARLVAINSVEGEASEDAPFGLGPRDALKLGLQIARELGLGAVDCEGRIGYAALGEGEKYLATITHLDVVPVADGWTGDPFVMREKDGWLLGRGVLDDKGPSVLCLYALKYLKEKEIPLRYPIRALLGANEETGMADVTYYLENYPAPVFCFSPDADFPLVNGEKGIFHGTLRSRVALDKIVDIHGGVAANAIPQKAEALVKAAQLRSAGRVTAEPAGEGLWKLTAEGVAGHASMPAGTVNAIGVLVDYLLENKVCSGDEEKLLELLAALHRHTDGSGLGVQADDGLFQPLTIVGGLIGVKDGVLSQSLDSRYPTNTSGAQIAAGIREKAGDLAEVTLERDAAPFYMPLDNPAIQACIGAYNAVTGENAEPFTIGGGTYARDFPNAVSFGPEHFDRPVPDFVGPIHGADEGACLEWLLEALKVYILALIELEKLDF